MPRRQRRGGCNRFVFKNGTFRPERVFSFSPLSLPARCRTSPQPLFHRHPQPTPRKILYPSIRPLYRAQTLFNNVLHKMDDYINPHVYIYTQTPTHKHVRRERKTPLQFYKTIKGWRRSAPLSYVQAYTYISRTCSGSDSQLSRPFYLFCFFSRIHSAAAVLFASPPLLLYTHAIYICVCVI